MGEAKSQSKRGASDANRRFSQRYGYKREKRPAWRPSFTITIGETGQMSE
jgi:hypothetical protein